jgi:hypothetical protein
MVARSKDSAVPHHVEFRWWNEGSESSEQGVWGQLGEEGAAGSGLFEVETHEAMGLQLHVVEGHGRPQHVGQLAPETSSVAAVEGRGGMQADSATLGEQRLAHGLGRRRRVGGGERPTQTEAGGPGLGRVLARSLDWAVFSPGGHAQWVAQRWEQCDHATYVAKPSSGGYSSSMSTRFAVAPSAALATVGGGCAARGD